MKKFWIYLLTLVVCAVSLFWIQDTVAIAIITGVIGSIVVLLVSEVAGRIENVAIWLISLRFRNSYIRLSISYLFRIKVDSEYLLIRSKRFPAFQPVGGVYKRFASSTTFFQELEILDDDLVPFDEVSKDDLRVRVKGKHLVAFISWFYSGKDRELSPWREFYEELVKPGHLPSEVFPYIFYRHIKRYEHPLRYSDYAKSQELLIADIYDLVLNSAQNECLNKLHASKGSTDELIWVDEDRVRRRGALPGENSTYEISLHSSWIL
jgi:hypothetical protein